MTSLAKARGVGIVGRLSPTDLDVAGGTMVAVIGPNGGGKTSLLRGLARTEDAGGMVGIEGQDIDQAGETQRRALLSFLPAAREAAWPISVADHLRFGLAAPDEARIERLLALLELEPLADRPIDRLSTGERARAMLGRALAARSRLLLLDEPLSNLDPYWVIRTVELIRGEVAAGGGAALVSVHDLSLIDRFDRVLLVSGGAVIGDGPPDAVLAGEAFGGAFRVEKSGPGWAIRPGDRRSSP